MLIQFIGSSEQTEVNHISCNLLLLRFIATIIMIIATIIIMIRLVLNRLPICFDFWSSISIFYQIPQMKGILLFWSNHYQISIPVHVNCNLFPSQPDHLTILVPSSGFKAPPCGCQHFPLLICFIPFPSVNSQRLDSSLQFGPSCSKFPLLS